MGRGRGRGRIERGEPGKKPENSKIKVDRGVWVQLSRKEKGGAFGSARTWKDLDCFETKSVERQKFAGKKEVPETRGRKPEAGSGKGPGVGSKVGCSLGVGGGGADHAGQKVRGEVGRKRTHGKIGGTG